MSDEHLRRPFVRRLASETGCRGWAPILPAVPGSETMTPADGPRLVSSSDSPARADDGCGRERPVGDARTDR